MSDALDGYLARKMEACSKLGQILDGISDFIFICVILSKVFLIIIIPLWAMYWALFIAIVRLTSFIICFIRYRQFAFLHTYANKITGIILFFFPLWYLTFGVEVTAVFLCSIASISAIEELLINLTSKELERDIKFIFSK
jgi:CDP-diacylglycerol--glycerol-3-phosphate 3-phosphatidyltransferase